MKNIIIQLTNIALLVMLIFAGVAIAEQKKAISGYDQDQRPLSYRDKNQQITGLDVELAKTIFARLGYTVAYRNISWKRHLSELEKGSGATFATSSVKTPEREQYAYFSAPSHKIVTVLFVRKGETKRYPFKTLSELKGKQFRIGVRQGVTYGEEFNKLLEDPLFKQQVIEVKSDEQNHRKLISGRLEGFLDSYMTYQMFAKKLGTADQIEPLFIVQEIPLHFMFSKKAFTPDFVDVFNEELAKLQQEGTYQALFKKYDMEPNMILLEP